MIDSKNLPSSERKTIKKRLYLRWHPDKNIGNEICTAVFQYLQERIVELDLELEDSEPDQGHSPCCQSFHRWNSQAKFQGEQRRAQNTNFQRNQHRQDLTDEIPQPKQKVPNLKESQRWFAQAKADLTAARQSLRGFSSQVLISDLKQI